MRAAVSTVERQGHLAAAAYLMRHADDTAVVVTTDDETMQPVGIITQTDITHAVADGKDLNETRIDEVIAREQVSVQPSTALTAATELMLSSGIQHLPVVEDGHLVGIIDVVDACRVLLSAASYRDR
ncbi:MAG TPA: CBS domain-containing protein [Asanoa sp.]